ncbi:hypothetical protein SAM23877_4333 [Streptomyces ambofaciens ATCC 23877]|uniref:Uncharacterized protein n=1 Tax=Streptomyces ambofaciens (strain ATCC 23877 / 3486 / DSM 40053 / JCM 4204 / NBRC 12836 / NRRL B-2516) TaxID=278992 RepID=A0A0K2AWL2_STRA7|nr:hypothetical protein SAM23877_4333 [Streptomyces ambofaciens ATCC 23877]
MSGSPPSDYRLLVPRDWFRVDLTKERWRGQLKTFVDKEFAGVRAPAETARRIWSTLRNTAEHGLSRGALEFFLRTEVPEGSTAPASLLISWPPMSRGVAPTPEEFAEAMAGRAGPEAVVEVVELPAGRSVRLRTKSNVDYHVWMPGDAGYLHLAFSVPLSGTDGPMGNLCDAIAHSLRWI